MTSAPGGAPTLTIARPPRRPERPGDALERALLRGLLHALVHEGRRFAQTPAGRRWRGLLAGSSLERQGGELWGLAGVDAFLRDGDGGRDSPRRMADDILALLTADEAVPAAALRVTLDAPAGGAGPP